jgi:anti-anti-sigma factor
MEINVTQLDNGIKRIELDGRLDMKNSQEIDVRFTALTATGSGPVLIDMSKVAFIASIGMRLLLSNAKALANRGGRMVLCNTQPLVQEALETAGLDTLIPLYPDEASAHAALLA